MMIRDSFSITVIKRMDAFELIMNDCHLYEWVYVLNFRFIDVFLEVIHQTSHCLLLLWLGIDNFACGWFDHPGARQFSYPLAGGDQPGVYSQYMVDCEHVILPDQLETKFQCV